MRFGTAFGAGLCGVSLRSDWPLHASANAENDAIMSASSSTGSHPPWRAHTSAAGSQYWEANTLDGGSWLQVQFASYRRATNYSLITIGTSLDVDYVLQGGNDGASWTTLDTASLSTIGGGSSAVNKAITIQTPFLFYRLLTTNAFTSSDLPGNEAAARFSGWSFTFSPT